jgi:hypothetical protein
MFTRVVELRAKPGKTNELSSAASGKVMPVLMKQCFFPGTRSRSRNRSPNSCLGVHAARECRHHRHRLK